MKQKDESTIKQLYDAALQSAIEWAKWNPNYEDGASEEVLNAQALALHQKMEADFNKYTLAKSGYCSNKGKDALLMLCYDRVAEAMKLVVAASHGMLLDDIYKLNRAFVEITEADATRSASYWEYWGKFIN